MLKNYKIWRGLVAVFGVLLAVSIFMGMLCNTWAGQINIFLGTLPPTVSDGDGDTMYYAGDYTIDDEGYEQMVADSIENDIKTMTEGAVLVKNEDAALPLASGERRVTLFGRSVADPIYRGNSGGAQIDPSRLIDLKTALEEEGFVINETLYNAYANSSTSRIKVAVTNAAGNRSSIGEEDISFYTQALRDTWANDYNDVAIVMLTRDGGEGMDLFYEDADGISQLALHQQETDLLEMIASSGRFDKTVVLINSAYPMELEWVEDERYGVDACLWIGGPGLVGFAGVADILVGNADPSGHFVDTYASNSLSSAAVQNAFDISFSNTEHNYIVEAEGIYVGYKYYETRYHDQVLGINNAAGSTGVYASANNSWDYAAEMAYPFGYGTSYASFTQSVNSIEWDRQAHTVTASVTVRNEGVPEGSSYTGKSKAVVQLYVQLPYEEGMAEKSAIQLVDFVKTDELAPGEEQTVSIVADDYLFATYDEEAVNGADSSRKGCYVFDEGDYYFAIGENAHDALNNVFAARGVDGMFDQFGNPVSGDANKAVCVELDAYDNTTYATSRETGEVVANLFDDVDINYYFDNDVVTYLTRADWNTFPQRYDNLQATEEMIAMMEDISYTKPADAPAYESFTQGADVTIKFVEMRDVPYDDERWETFLNQLTITDMSNMVGENFGQPAVTSVGKPANTNSDGPSGPQVSYNGNAPIMHVNEVVAASTWNKDLLASRGKFIAEDCLFGGTTQLWSPGCNIHRTPFSGRNFEYYSEDSIMSYLCGAAQCEAMQAYGVNAAPKHFVGNDQETNRTELCTYMTEQALRQGPFKGFEGAFIEGGALGTMLSTSKIGNREIYTDYNVMTGLLRDEWGWKGVTITDSVAHWSTTNPTIKALAAGNDTFNARTACGTEVRTYIVKNRDGYLLQQLRLANKHYFYAMSRSNIINGLTVDTVVSDFVPWWQTALLAIEVVIGVAAAGCAVMFVLTRFVLGRKKEEKA